MEQPWETIGLTEKIYNERKKQLAEFRAMPWLVIDERADGWAVLDMDHDGQILVTGLPDNFAAMNWIERRLQKRRVT